MEDTLKTDTPALSEAACVAFFDTVLACALQAEQRVGRISRYVELAGTLIEMAYAGDSLLPAFSSALAHIEVIPARLPDMTFHIWDSESTGVAIPPPPFPKSSYTDRGDIWGMTSPRIRSAFHWIECSVNVMDLQRGIAVYWVQSLAILPYWCYASPLRTLFHWWMTHNNCQLLHAAAVGNADGALLITGKGGVGKSTSALSSLMHGLHYLADDYLVVGMQSEPRVYSLYCTAKLEPGQLAKFPEFQALLINPAYLDTEKAVVQLWPTYSDHVVRSLPLRAISTPHFAGQSQTRFAPAAKLALQRAAAFTTLSQLPHAGRETYTFIERLIEELPCLEMALGQDIATVPVAINALLQRSHAGLTEFATFKTDTIAAQQPLISVIIPVYNGAAFLADAVANVLAQQYPALEIIVVDDGSSDAIEAAVDQLPVDARFFRQENSGAASARNRGIKDASGEFIAFLDVDDLWPENNLQLLVDCLGRSPELQLVHGYAQILVYNGASGDYDYVGNPSESFPYYIGAGLYRRSAFERVGLFDTELRYAEDTDWFNRAAEQKITVERLAMVTLHVRRHGANMTAGKSLVELNALRVFKKSLDRQRAAMDSKPQTE